MSGRRLAVSVYGCAMLLLAAAGAIAAPAPELRIAVAASFAPVAERLCKDYFAARPGRCTVSSGASGLLATQVAQGAPFEVFLSADSERPARLVADGLADPGSRFTYAIGRLVLWIPAGTTARTIDAALGDRAVRTLAIANPDAAPYGAAAIEVLRRLGWPRDGRPVLVQGTNVAQAFQFVESGAADAGFVATAQVLARRQSAPVATPGDAIDVPAAMHAPIEQQAVLLARAAGDPDARGFLDYLRSEPARTVISAAGYDLPSR
jgi:molybdate transport system substrate-binding protein